MRRRTHAVIAAFIVLAFCAGPGNAKAATGAPLDAGGQAYLAQCAVCHGPGGRGDGPLAASIIAEHRSAPAVLDSTRVNSLGKAGVIRAIEGDPHRRSGSAMPLWGPHLGSDWIQRIAGFVVRMPASGDAGRKAVQSYLAAPARTPPAGRRTYVLYCSSCHGPQGGADGFFSPTLALKIPRLRGDSYRGVDDAALARFISPGGAHALNAPSMPGWLYTISPDDRKALVAYLRVLPGSPVAR